ETVVETAAAAHRVALGAAQAGQRLSRIHDPGVGALDAFDEIECGAGNAAEQLQEIQGCAFTGEQRAHRTLDPAYGGVGANTLAVTVGPFDRHALVQCRKDVLEPGRAGQNGVFARNNAGTADPIRVYQRGVWITVA